MSGLQIPIDDGRSDEVKNIQAIYTDEYDWNDFLLRRYVVCLRDVSF